MQGNNCRHVLIFGEEKAISKFQGIFVLYKSLSLLKLSKRVEHSKKSVHYVALTLQSSIRRLLPN